MGVYFPPGSGKNGNNDTSAGDGGGIGGGTITIPNPSAFIPRNPSIGLKIWGPLVPASDNVAGLYFLTGLQIGIGLLSFNKARQLRKINLMRTGLENTMARRLTKWACITGGSYLIFQSGLEMTRLSLPYDPWYEEAQHYRRVATKNGDSPSWWFGAFSYYQPMSFSEWNSKVEGWITNQVNIFDLEDKDGNRKSVVVDTGDGTITSPFVSNLSRRAKYNEIYRMLHENNKTKFTKMLTDDLKDVTELNKAERLDLILEGTSPVPYDEDYGKPPIKLGNHTIDSDYDFDMAWLTFEPWDELKQDTDYDVRLIPRWRWQEDADVKENDQTVDSED